MASLLPLQKRRLGLQWRAVRLHGSKPQAGGAGVPGTPARAAAVVKGSSGALCLAQEASQSADTLVPKGRPPRCWQYARWELSSSECRSAMRCAPPHLLRWMGKCFCGGAVSCERLQGHCSR